MLTKQERTTIEKLRAEIKEARSKLTVYLQPKGFASGGADRKVTHELCTVVEDAEQNYTNYLDAITEK